MKKVFVFAVFFLIPFLFSAEARADKKIGILMFSGETRYHEAARGFLDKLKENGFGEPQNKIVIENAGGNKAKATELVQKFAKAEMDLIFTLGTSATIAVSREITDVPIVFGMVYDPVEAGVARNWDSSGNNTTGATTKLPMSKLMDVLQAFAPVKRLGVLYTPAEKNSSLQLKDLQTVQANYAVKVIPVPLTQKEEIAQILPMVISTVDAVYVTGSNLVDAEVSMVVDIASKAKVVTISHLEDLVEKGVLLGLCADSYENGSLAGEKAVKILKGAKPSSIPIEIMKEQDVMLNMKTVKAGQFRIPPEFMKKVRRKIQ